MIGSGRMKFRRASVMQIAPAVLLLIGLAGCSAGSIFGGQPEASPTPAPAAEPTPAAPAPQSANLAGRWQLSAAAGGACFMNFAATAATSVSAAADASEPRGTIAPEGGCPGNFFTSRKWTFEQGTLIISDFKGRQLAQLSYVGGHFEGRDASGAALTLSKQL